MTFKESDTRQGSWWPSAALLLAVFLWGSSYAAMKVVVASFGPMPTVWARMVAASILFLILGWRHVVQIRLGKDWKWLLLLFFCQPCMYFLCEGFALNATSSAQAGMISAILPLMVMVGAYVVLHETNTLITWAGCLLSLGGVIWLTLESVPTRAAPNPLLGNLLEVAAMGFAAGYMLLMRRLSGRYSPFVLTGMQCMAGSLFFLPGGLSAVTWQAPVESYVLLVYLGTLVTLGAFGLYNWGISRVPAGRASVFVNLVPVIAVCLGVVVMDETLNTAQMLACALVFAGVLLAQMSPPRTK
ncbi:MAG: EamA family transporter [Deltaproteobacteria bacterium]|nr:MAG: EamA family transporter [Deltaproteobacteria bacterium]